MFIKDLLNELTYTQVCASGTAITTTGTSSSVNLAGLIGECVLIIDIPSATSGTNPAITVALTTCSTSDGAYVPLNDAAGSQIVTEEVTDSAGNNYQVISFDTRIAQQYLKLSWTVGGTTPSFPSLGVSLVSSAQVY